MSDSRNARKKPFGKLITALPRLVVGVLKAEVEHLKAEFAAKVKYAGVGIGLFLVAAVLLFFALGVLVAAAVLGLAVVLPGWAAALTVFGALALIAAILVLIGVASFKKVNGLAPKETIASVRSDADALRGMGKYDN
ncbi:hypothetical protein ATY41_07640 [Leifsonia xyli subsp. xyli]|uniref:Phage holin family protein n=1 Tax=Leifsonia xyli subsp. xyli TaxID=59736 RepID=A0A1E2SMR1_LEIXY|nr:phage holin family protein [Leifsonia xyli]ODA90928.1 hypothetical protein ATY41_07640 [Leifsonia xyli subsp. xyli]